MRRLLFFKILIVFLLTACAQQSPSVAMASESDVEKLLSRYVIKESQTPIREHAGWRKPKRVVIYVPDRIAAVKPDYKTWFREAAGDAQIIFVATGAEFRKAAVNADVALGSCGSLPQTMKNVRWVQRYGVGVEDCLSNPALKNPEILLTNTRGLSGPYIAEHVIAMSLMLSHSMHQYYANQLDGKWLRSRENPKTVEPVAGKRLLVVGLGGIGTKVAEKAAALGMRVTAIRNSSRNGPDFVDYVGLSGELLTLAGDADIVVNTLPLTKKTTGLFDKEFFSAMKASAHFISIGRGKSVVTDDLVAALNAGEIAGAGLDVTDPEPLPVGHPLWKAPNVLITPHTSGRSGYGSVDTLVFVRENLRRYVAGEPMLNVVDRSLEY